MVANEEIWKPIPGYTGYEVSNSGRVRSLDRVLPMCGHRFQKERIFRGRVLKATPDNKGYPRVCLTHSKPEHVHTLMLRAFVGPPGPKQEARHLNDVRSDNRLENLVWGTRSENTQDKFINGGMARQRAKIQKLTDHDVKILRDCGRLFSTRVWADVFGVSHVTIGHVLRGLTYQHVRNSRPGVE